MRWGVQPLLMTMFCLLSGGIGAAEEVRCTGPFGPDASHADLVKAFGAANVSYEDVFMKGRPEPMTILFGNDPDRRLSVHWRDRDSRRGLDFVSIQSPGWSVGGAVIGMPIGAVEQLNGQPFKLADFIGQDEDGTVLDWRNGKLGLVQPGGCRVGAIIGINDSDAYQGQHEGNTLSSDDEVLRAADPRLYELIVSFPKAAGGR